MNPSHMARQAYAPNHAAIRSPRGTEQELFARVTRRLRAASEGAVRDHRTLVEVLHENRQIWTHLAAEVADSDNALPNDLRARIFYLAEFTQHQSRKVLAGAADVGVLVEINTAMMRGLTESGAAA